MALDILRITDPGCPFAYSAEPAQTVLLNRYRDQINWSIAMIGLAEDGAVDIERGYGPTEMAKTYASFSRRYGMPVTSEARKRPLATWPACRVVIATRLTNPESEAAVQRALQVAWFTTTAMLDEDEPLIEAISEVPGIDAAAIVSKARTDDEVAEVFAADRAKARSADGSPTQAQGKHAMDGSVARYTAPSLLMHDQSGRPLEAGGFQPVEAYDVVIANADPTLTRHSSETPLEVLEASAWALSTAEVASVLTAPFTPRDDAATEQELIVLAAEGRIARKPAGNGVFWSVS
jgi:predicted DsbA family dithiol-disulfide isomerase